MSNKKKLPRESDTAKTKNVGAGDWDKGIQWVLNFTGHKTERYSKKDFLNGVAFAAHRGATLYIEASHLQERLTKSISQIYTKLELIELYRQAALYGVTIIAFPQKMTPRAREEFGVDKSEDAYAIRMFATKYHVSRKVPVVNKDRYGTATIKLVDQPIMGMMKARIPTEADKAVWARRNGTRTEMSDRLT